MFRTLSARFHLLLITALGFPLLTPLLHWTAVPCTHDGHLHYHRIAALRHAWESGLYFTRWLPDLAFGYGYPFLVYREPLPLYVGLFPHLLGLPLPATSNLMYAVCILAGGWFMYAWVREVLGDYAGVVSAVCYMAAPYVLVDAFVRGNLPESFALPLFPFLLWQGRRWMLTHTAQSFLLTVLGLAVLSLSHNISLLLFTPVLFVYLVTVVWVNRPTAAPSPLHPAVKLLLLFGLGLGVTFFYSGGAVLEMDAVTLQQSTTTRNNDFRYNFATLAEIFAPVPSEDPLLINPPLPFRLGWVPTGLALVGILSLWRHKLTLEQRWYGWLMVAGTAVFLFMSLSLSQFIWEGVPLIDFVQFPWRFVGRAALPVAFLAGLPFVGFEFRVSSFDKGRVHSPKPRQLWLYPTLVYLAVGLLMVEAFPMLYPNLCREGAFPSINQVHQYEHETGLVGVDPEGSYFPRTVLQRPISSPLEADYQAANLPPRRFDESVLPAGATVSSISYQNNATTLTLTTPTPFTARYLTFAFPGWQAEVDGTAVPITSGDPDGLITFPIPAGTHHITIRWGSTPLRTALSLVSVTALVTVLGVAAWLRRRTILKQPVATSPTRPLVAGLGLALALLLGKTWVVDRLDTPLRRVSPPPVAQTAVLQGNELRLEGYTLSQTTVEAGNTFDIHLAWTAVSPPSADYQSNVWLVGPEGLTWSNKGTQRPRLYEDAGRTQFWLPGQWAWDSREVLVLSGTPPGVYDIVLTLFDLATLQPLTLHGADGAVVGPTAVIGHITVTPDTDPQLNPQYPLQNDIATLGTRLLGYNLDRSEAVPGDVVLVTLFWEKMAQPTPETFTLLLLVNGRSIAHTWELPITRPDITTWQPGQQIRGQYLLRLPAGLESGDYQFALEGNQFGLLTVRAPERLFTQPTVETAVLAPFRADDTPVATLVGYTITPDASGITLVWQATAEMSTSYHVFAHLVFESGDILTQTDGQPVNWTRPTTGWAVGEYLTDFHPILPPYQPADDTPLFLRIGLYNPDTNERLLTETADFITIPWPRK